MLPRTVVALSNAVLYPPTLSQIRNLGPVLVGVGGRAEGTARALSSVLRGRRRGLGESSILHVALEHGLAVVVCWVMAGHVVFAVRKVIRRERRRHGELRCQHVDAESFTEGDGALQAAVVMRWMPVSEALDIRSSSTVGKAQGVDMQARV